MKPVSVDHSIPAEPQGYCQATYEGLLGYRCPQPVEVMVHIGCEHEHMSGAGMCSGCLERCRVLEGEGVPGECRQCGHECRVMIVVIKTGEKIIF